MFCAIETRDVRETKKILWGHNHLVSETRGLEKRTALHHATEHGNLQICEILIESGADINKKDARQHPPLWFAAINGNIDICHLLIYHGADMFCVDQDNASDSDSVPNERKNSLFYWIDSHGRFFFYFQGLHFTCFWYEVYILFSLKILFTLA